MSRHTQPTGQNKVAATQQNASLSRPLEQAPALVQEEIVPFEQSAVTLSRALGDHRPHLPLQRVQRQQMVGRIAQHYGNGHLGQLVAIGGGAQAAHRRNEEREMIGYRQESIHAALRPGKDDVKTSHNVPDKSVVSVQAARPVVAAWQSASAVQRWSLSDFVPDALKIAGRSVAKFAGKAVDSVTDLAQTALHAVAPLARRIPGYSLLSVVLGKDPISDQETPATPSTLVGGIVGLIPGGDKLFENLQTANSLDAAFGWLQAQLAGLNLTWDYVKDRFAKAWVALSAADFLAPTRAFAKIGGVFLPLIGRIKQFAVAAGNKIWELAFEGAMKLAGPSAGMVLNVIKRACGAFSAIVKDPIGFLGRLIDGLGQGFQNFGANIGAHLQTGFVGWLTGAMRGASLQLPENVFSLEGTFDLVTQVLGITKEYIRAKAVKLLGERTVGVAEQVFEPLVVLFNEGPLGLLRFAQEQFSNLKELVMDQIQDLLSNQVVRAGIRWMMALLSPAGALLKAATTIYDIITFMVERANQMVEFVDSVVGSIGAIARGAIGGAAKLIEGALAKSLPVLIGFLANLVGVGGVAEKVLGIFRKVRGKVDAAIEKFILKVKKVGQRLLANLGVDGKDGVGKGEAKDTPEEQSASVAAIAQEERQYIKDGVISHEDAQKTAVGVKQKHPVFQSVTVVDGGDSWDYQYVFRADGKEDTASKKAEAALLQTARTAMAHDLFDLAKLQKWLKITASEAAGALQDWIAQGHLYEGVARGVVGYSFNQDTIERYKAIDSIPQSGEYGHVGEHHENQSNTHYLDPANKKGRLTESEHLIPRGNLEALTYDPITGRSDYDDRRYRSDTTYLNERGAALDKTSQRRGGAGADNPRTRDLKERIARGEQISFTEDVLTPSVENANRAGNATDSSVTDEARARAALAQTGNLFETFGPRSEDEGAATHLRNRITVAERLGKRGDEVAEFDEAGWDATFDLSGVSKDESEEEIHSM